MKPRMLSILRMLIFLNLNVTIAIAGSGRPVFTTFSTPKTGTGAGQGTIPLQITTKGTVVGIYIDSNGAYHGFLRPATGKIVPIDAPGAGTASGQGTVAASLLDVGLIVGYLTDSNNVSHGFAVAWQDQRLGKFVTLDAPGAGTGPGQGTVIYGVNSTGVIYGSFFDSNTVEHGTIRSPRGGFTNFDPVGSVSTFGASPGINDAGTVIGTFADSSGLFDGFLRDADGAITSFNVPNSQLTFTEGINQKGVICGYDADSNFVLHAYVRATDGTLTTFDAPHAGKAGNQGTLALAIDPLSQVTVGYYLDAKTIYHGFVRNEQGALVSFDAPGSGSGPGQGTLGYFINSTGAITGPFIDGNGVQHAFILTQQ